MITELFCCTGRKTEIHFIAESLSWMFIVPDATPQPGWVREERVRVEEMR